MKLIWLCIAINFKWYSSPWYLFIMAAWYQRTRLFDLGKKHLYYLRTGSIKNKKIFCNLCFRTSLIYLLMFLIFQMKQPKVPVRVRNVVRNGWKYWVTQKLPQIYTANHATFQIQIGKITVLICGNFWVTQYLVSACDWSERNVARLEHGFYNRWLLISLCAHME